MLTFKLNYFIFTILLLISEVLIALFVDDEIIRPYVGDVLVVILLYCFSRSFLDLPVITTAILVLLFSYLIETLQYFNVVRRLGLEHSRLANTVIGNYFTWVDILAYTLGFLVVLVVENRRNSGTAQLQSTDDNLWLFL